MTLSADRLRQAADNLYGYMLEAHWNGRTLEGPDSGIRWNAKVLRFAKSYLSFIDWQDNHVYLQAQAYWIRICLEYYAMTGDEAYRQRAELCSQYILDSQHKDGYWEYPNPEWKGRIATVEGDFAAMGLLDMYYVNGREELLAASDRWYDCLNERVGYHQQGGMLAVHYFANAHSELVPNNSTLTLMALAKMAHVTGDDRYLEKCAGMVRWLKQVQLDTGELPYAVAATPDGEDEIHFLCYQYNAFEYLDLAHYYEWAQDESVLDIMRNVARYLSGGVMPSGASKYNCFKETPEVTYYTAALASALSHASANGLGDYSALAEKAFSLVLSQQKPDGSFQFFSRHNYGVLSDQRSYPRNLAMILAHFLSEYQRRLAPVSVGSV